MNQFGKYSLSYIPPDPEETGLSEIEPIINMTVSSEASLADMLRLFETFLKSTGYQIDGKELCLERSAPDFNDFDLFDSPWSSQSTVVNFENTPSDR